MSKQIQSLKLSDLRPKIAVRNYKNGAFPTFAIGASSFAGYYFVPIVNSNYSDINLCRVQYLISFSSTGSNQIIDWDLDFGDGESSRGYKLENPTLHSNITSNSTSLKCKLEYGSNFVSLPPAGTILIDNEYIHYSGKSFNFTTPWSKSAKYGASSLTKTLPKNPFKIISAERQNDIVTLTTDLYHNIEPNESLIISELPFINSESLYVTGLNNAHYLNMPYAHYFKSGMTLTGSGIRSASTTATQAIIGSRTITVADATGIVAGHFVKAVGIPSDTQVIDVSGTTVSINKQTTGILNSTSISFVTKVTDYYNTFVTTTATQTTSGSFTITVANATGITIGSSIYNNPEGIPTDSEVTDISGTTLTLNNPTTKSISGVSIMFKQRAATISTRLSSALTGSTLITGSWDNDLNGTFTTIDGTKDNIIKYKMASSGNIETQSVSTGSAFVNQIQLEDVDDFASSGSVLIDNEVISYTGKATIGASTATGTGRTYNTSGIILGDIDVGDDNTSIIVSKIDGLPSSGTVLIDEEQIYYGLALEEYTTGTITQLAGTYTVVGSATAFTSAMVGATLIYADGQAAKIVGCTNGTHLTVDQDKTISSSQSYRIPHQLINCRRGANGTDAVEHESVTNEIQTVTISNATGGNFRLTFNGQQTANIAHNATATVVQTALTDLSNISPTGVLVTDNRYDGNGDAVSPAPNSNTVPLVFYIEFTGEYQYTDVAQLTVSDSTTGTGHSVVVGTETAWTTGTVVDCLTLGAVQITSGEFKVGNTITGTGIQSGTTITAIDNSVYSTGTISQTDQVVTGVGTSFTTDMDGSTITYSDGSTATIFNVTSATSLLVSKAKTVAGGSSYSIATKEFTLSKPATAAATGVAISQTIDGDVIEALTGLTRGTQETSASLHLEDSLVGQIAVYKNRPYVCILSNNSSGTEAEAKNPDDNSMYWFPINDQNFVITLNNLSRGKFGSTASSHLANTQICSVVEVSHLYKYDGGGDAGTILHEDGTITQSGYTVTGSGTTFTSGMVGQILKYADESPLPDIPVLNGDPVSSGSTGLSAGTYYYVVTATNSQGESLPSAVSSAITISGTKTITVNWLATDGATGYKVYRSTVNKNFTTSNTALAATINSGSTLTFADTGSGTTGAIPPVTLPKFIGTAEITAVNTGAQTLTVNKPKTITSGSTYQIWTNPGATHQNGAMNVILTGTDNHNRKFATRTTVYPKYINETLLTA